MPRQVLRIFSDESADAFEACEVELALAGGCLELSWRRGLVRVVATHAKEDGMPVLWVEPALQTLFCEFYGYSAPAHTVARRLRDSVEEQVEVLTGWQRKVLKDNEEGER